MILKYRPKDRVTSNYSAQLKISMCDEEPVKLFSEVFLHPYKILKHMTKKGRPIFYFQVCSKDAIKVINALLPFLRIKKNQAELLLKLDELNSVFKRKKKRTLSPEVVEQKERLYRSLRELHFK